MGIKVTIIFIEKYLHIASKIFATRCSFTDHLKRNITHKKPCRMPSANPRQL